MLYTSLMRSKIRKVYSSVRRSHLLLLDTIHHTGIKLATRAYSMSPIISVCTEAISLGFWCIKVSLRYRVQQNWEKLSLEHSLTNKLRVLKTTTQQWASSVHGFRKIEFVLTMIWIGHTNFTLVHLITKNSEPICQTCQIHMKSRHIIENCPQNVKAFRKMHIVRNNPCLPYYYYYYYCKWPYYIRII